MSDFPQIFTFFSFKGGVGRSMAVLNVAYGLAARGRNVLMLDMDLEAPGLSGFLRRHNELEGFAECDLVDLMRWAREFADAAQEASGPLDSASFPPLSDFVVGVPREKLDSLQRKFGELGRVDIIPVDEERDYYGRLTALGMGGFDQDSLVRVGSVLRSWLKSGRCPLEVPDYYGPKAPRSAPYDYILVDSRTGVTEIGGLCIGPLSDQLVVLTALNDQNVEGTRRFLEEVGVLSARPAEKVDTSEDTPPHRLDPKPTLMVASPVPVGEIATKRDRLEQLQKSVGQVVVKLSYHPQMALLESIFVRDFPDEYLAQEYDELIDQVFKLARDGADFDFAQAAADLKSGLLGNRREIAQWAIRRGPRMLLPLLLLFFDLKTITDEEDFIIVDRLCRKLATPTQRAFFSVTGPFFWADALTEWSLRSTFPELAALRRTAAMRQYEDVLDKNDASTKQKAKALFSRAVAHGRLGDSERAILDYTAVLELPDAPAEQKAQALGNRGWEYFVAGRYADAIADHREAISFDQELCIDRSNLAIALLVDGQTEEALVTYDTALETADLEDLADMANDLNEAMQKHGPITGANDILARIESRQAELES